LHKKKAEYRRNKTAHFSGKTLLLHSKEAVEYLTCQLQWQLLFQVLMLFRLGKYLV